MIIDCISDLHGFYPDLEGGDLLIVAGDLTSRHTSNEFYDFADWMRNQKYNDKIVIAGNHDAWIFNEADAWDIDNWSDIGEFEFLCDSGTEFEYEEEFPHPAGNDQVSIDCLCYDVKKLKIWGSPWTKRFPGMNPKAMAFTVDTEEELAEKWALIRGDIDILVTHSPPYGILDTVIDHDRILLSMPPLAAMKNVGSKTLNYAIALANPKIIIFGHIHEQGGKIMNLGRTKFINASHVNEYYEPVNKPIRVIL